MMSQAAASTTSKPAPSARPVRFQYSLNTSTVRGQNLTLPQQVDLAAKAGYDGIEPWLREINAYVKGGGSLTDLRKRIDDAGLKVPSAIGFAQWIVDDPEARKKGLEEARRDMETMRTLGGIRIAAPPAGNQQKPSPDLFVAAERYRQLLELGREMGVVPQVEVWGFSKTLSRLGEAMFVAIEAGHPDACVLADVYHIHKGGSDFHGLKVLSGVAAHVFHVNDYPATPARDVIQDADRVYPGDGVAPLGRIFQTLHATGFEGFLSLELFNPEYWKRDAFEVAKTGLEKTRDAVAKAFA